jgi:hypothetical protein
MHDVATIRFTDLDSDDDAVAIVRASDHGVALAISLRDDGDIEVVLPADACDQLITALRQAQQSTA